MNILITLYLFGLIGVCIISYFDIENGNEPLSILKMAIASTGGLFIFAFGLWVLKEEMRYSRENAAFDKAMDAADLIRISHRSLA